MLYILEHCLLALALGLSFWLAGRLLASGLNSTRYSLGELGAYRGLAELCLGLVCWVALLFALAAVGWLCTWSLTGAMLGLLLLAAIWRQRLAPGSDSAGALGYGRGELVLALLLGLYLLPVLMVTLGPAVSWDASVYHLTLPKIYLRHGGFVELPWNVYSHWPQNTELLYALALGIKDHVLAKLLHFGFGVAVLYALVVGCRRLGGGRVGWLAALFFLANDVVMFELRTAYVELAHAFFLLGAFLFLCQALDSEQRRERQRWLLLAGLCGGMVAGTKLTGIVGVAILALLYLPRLLRGTGHHRAEHHRAELRRDFATRFALPVAVLWAPWLVKSAWWTGNPVYPALYGVLGGSGWSARLAEQLAAWQSSIGMGREPLDYLLLIPRVLLNGGQGYEHFDGRLGAFWLVLLPATLIAGWRLPAVRRALFVVALCFVFWSLTSQQSRLLVPLLPLAALAAGLALADLLGKLRNARMRQAGWALLGCSVALLAVVDQQKVLRGGWQTSKILLREEGERVLASVIDPVWLHIDELPEQSRLLMIDYNRAFFCERDYIADSFFEASQLVDWLQDIDGPKALNQHLAAEGITHLLLRKANWGIPYPQELLDLVRDPSRVRPTYKSPDGGYLLLELH